MTQRNGASPPDVIEGRIYAAEQIPPLDLQAMFRVVWHGKWLIIGATLLMVTLAGFYAFRVVPPQYAATATLKMDHPTPGAGMSLPPDASDTALNTKVAQVTSDPVLTNVITDLDLLADAEFNRYLSPPGPFAIRTLRTQLRHLLAGTSEQAPDADAISEKTIQNLRSALSVTRQPDTYILHITARSRDPQKAARLANATAAQFLNHSNALHMDATMVAETWLQSRVNELREQLETENMQAAALIATAQLQEGSGLDTLSAQVLAADQDLIAIRNALATREIAPQNSSVRDAAEIAQMRDRVAELAALKERLSAQLSAQSAGLAQLHQIQLQAEATRQLYQTFLARLHENRMQQGLNTPNLAQITPATDGAFVGPRKVLILMIAMMLGATAGILTVIILHNTRRGAVDARSLRDATGLPVFAQLSTGAIRRLRKGRQAFPLPSQSALSVAGRNLLTALVLRSQEGTAQVVLSTSSVAAEGKSQQAIALAHAWARAGKRVVLIAADGGDTVLRSVIGPVVFQAAREGWSSEAPKAHDAGLGADILVVPDRGDDQVAITFETVSETLQDLRKIYDYIVIDGPPVLHDPDALVFAHHADAIIYAVRWSKTPLSIVQRGLEILNDIGSPASGLVLTKVNLRKMRKLSDDPCIAAIQTIQAI